MTKAYLIEAQASVVRAVEWDGTVEGMRKLIGGYIEAAAYHPNGDVLYVDEEGLLKPQMFFIQCRAGWLRDEQPLGGNGLWVGRELVDDEGEFIGNAEPATPLDVVSALFAFRDRAYVDAWAAANASDPFISVSRAEGTEVIASVGSFFNRMPRS